MALDTGSRPASGDFFVTVTPDGGTDARRDVANNGVAIAGAVVTLIPVVGGGAGTDHHGFATVAGTGQIGVAAGAALDHEAKAVYQVRVIASDGTDRAAVKVDIIVTDVNEPPGPPGNVAVAGASATGVTVTWTEPAENTGQRDGRRHPGFDDHADGVAAGG